MGLIYKTLEELADAEDLCGYCELDPDTNYGSPNNGYWGCEGSRCDEAYQAYLDKLEITEKVITINNKTKVTIERSQNATNT